MPARKNNSNLLRRALDAIGMPLRRAELMRLKHKRRTKRDAGKTYRNTQDNPRTRNEMFKIVDRELSRQASR